TLLNEPHMDRLRKELLGTAKEFYLRFVNDRRNDPQAKLDLGRAYIRLSNITDRLGAKGEAIAHVHEAPQLSAALTPAPPQVTESHTSLAGSLPNLGILFHTTGRAPAAEAAYQRAVKEYEALAAAHPEQVVFSIGLGNTYLNMGTLIRDQGDHQAA